MKKFILKSKDEYSDYRKHKTVDDKLFLWSFSDGFWESIKRIKKEI